MQINANLMTLTVFKKYSLRLFLLCCGLAFNGPSANAQNEGLSSINSDAQKDKLTIEAAIEKVQRTHSSIAELEATLRYLIKASKSNNLEGRRALNILNTLYSFSQNRLKIEMAHFKKIRATEHLALAQSVNPRARLIHPPPRELPQNSFQFRLAEDVLIFSMLSNSLITFETTLSNVGTEILDINSPHFQFLLTHPNPRVREALNRGLLFHMQEHEKIRSQIYLFPEDSGRFSPLSQLFAYLVFNMAFDPDALVVSTSKAVLDELAAVQKTARLNAIYKKSESSNQLTFDTIKRLKIEALGLVHFWLAKNENSIFYSAQNRLTQYEIEMRAGLDRSPICEILITSSSKFSGANKPERKRKPILSVRK